MATTVKQRMVSLDKANAIRTVRATELREMQALPSSESLERAAELLLEPPAWLHSLPVASLLKRVRRLGATGAITLCNRVGCSTHTPIGRLTLRQRIVLETLLVDKASEKRKKGR